MRIIGHRGQVVTGGPPENTVAAARAALAASADGIEVDVRLSGDNVALCVHDPELRRLAGRPDVVAHSPWHVLREIPLPGDRRIARLDEILGLVAGRGTVVLDLKHEAGRAEPLAAAVIDAVQRHEAAHAVVVSSASATVLAAVCARDPELRRALITGPRTTMRVGLSRTQAGGHHDLHPHVSAVLADHTAAERAAADGLTLRAWTVNRPVDAHLLDLVGVAEVITDVPGLLRTALHPPAARLS